MPSPKVSFDESVELPFLVDFYPDDDVGEDDVDHAQILERMEAAVPKSAVKLGVVDFELDHSPGLTWKIEEHYFLVPIRGGKYEWALVRVHWDDNMARYEWAEEAVGSGFKDAQEAGRAMLAGFLEHCDIDLADEGNAEYRALAERL